MKRTPATITGRTREWLLVGAVLAVACSDGESHSTSAGTTQGGSQGGGSAGEGGGTPVTGVGGDGGSNGGNGGSGGTRAATTQGGGAGAGADAGGTSASGAGGAGEPNHAPEPPVIHEPGRDGQLVSGADVHMETAPMQDVDADEHRCTDWEIWDVASEARVWRTACIDGAEKLHTHMGDGSFEGSLAGELE
ncbi:MAG TPA: hypothetical protein VFU02_06145, partial [Polyangiaceae bacterium]|nr:hypothetical protein [Polyangiaceae bacterium]